MQNELKISFVLPCYNVAPYVGRCIESIEHQDIPLSEYEVICVDDCSKDNTVEVIKEYQKHYPNIRLICHAQNKTAGGARNTGLDAAKGEYIWFVDPDDKVEFEVLSKLYTYATRLNLDILSFNIIDREENGTTNKTRVFENTNEVMCGEDFLHQKGLRGLHSMVSVYANIYNRKFIIQNVLRFPEIKASEDVVFIWRGICMAKRYSAISDFCYTYIRRPDSITGSKKRWNAQKILSFGLLFPLELQKILDDNIALNDRSISEIQSTIIYGLNTCSKEIIHAEKVERKKFYHMLKSYGYGINCMYPIMNRKAKMIYRYNLPYCAWTIALDVYRFHENNTQK